MPTEELISGDFTKFNKEELFDHYLFLENWLSENKDKSDTQEYADYLQQFITLQIFLNDNYPIAYLDFLENPPNKPPPKKPVIDNDDNGKTMHAGLFIAAAVLLFFFRRK